MNVENAINEYKEHRSKYENAIQDEELRKPRGSYRSTQLKRVRRFVRDQEKMDEMEREYWESQYEGNEEELNG